MDFSLTILFFSSPFLFHIPSNTLIFNLIAIFGLVVPMGRRYVGHGTLEMLAARRSEPGPGPPVVSAQYSSADD